MLSGIIHSIPLTSITVSPDRQRQNFRDIDSLADSIRQLGLINPIVVTPDHVLVAGERRLRACQQLGLTHISAHYTSDLDPTDLELIELEENVKRDDLTWKEHVASVARLHELKCGEDPTWTLSKSSQYLSITASAISNYILVSRYLDQGDDLIVNAQTYSMALNAARRKEERLGVDDAETLDEAFDKAFSTPFSGGGIDKPRKEAEGFSPTTLTEKNPPPTLGNTTSHCPINQMDFSEWASLPLDGRPVNFLHCDFPYGINYHRHNGGAATSIGKYDDSPEAYDRCFAALELAMATHISESAHIMFWVSARHDRIADAIGRLESMGWAMNPVPIIWHRSDNAGILPDPQRGPRQIYETALIGSRGDRKIVQAVGNLFPHKKTRFIHASEKPLPVLEHFFRMFVDNSTVLLDPTCGSGNAVIAAERMGARSVCGLEVAPAIYLAAKRNWESHREAAEL